MGARNIYDAVDAIAERGVRFMPGPPEAYYRQSFERVTGHEEPVDRMKKHGILIDGEGVVDCGETRILLQIFSKTVIGPIFFEFIERKGDDGFGGGQFQGALRIDRGRGSGGRGIRGRRGGVSRTRQAAGRPRRPGYRAPDSAVALRACVFPER